MNFTINLCLNKPISRQPYLRIDVVREGRDPGNEFGSGTIIRATCAKEYRLNLQNLNGTAKCVRGRWKPMKPECSVSISYLPSAYLDQSQTQTLAILN